MTKNEFERLKPGQMIQNKHDNKWAFIVHQNFGDHLTGVRTIQIDDPDNWDIITKVEIPPNEKPPENEEFRNAAHELHEKLKNYDWYGMVGMGNLELIVYTSKKKYPVDIATFGGFPVRYTYVGKMAPLGGV